MAMLPKELGVGIAGAMDYKPSVDTDALVCYICGVEHKTPYGAVCGPPLLMFCSELCFNQYKEK